MKNFTFVFILSMFLASVFAQNTEQDPSVNYLNPNHLKVKSTGWTVQFAPDIASAVWGPGTYGAEADSNYVYLSKWASNKFYKLTTAGAVADSFALTGTPAFPAGSGIRDLAYDGQFFYGGTNSNIIYKMDFTAKAIVSAITLPVGFAVRHIAYDPTADGGLGGLWVGPWNTQGPRLYSMTGVFLDSIPYANLGTASISGSAYDNVTAGGPYLWLYSQASTGNANDLIQVRISSKQMTGLFHDLSTDIPAIAAVSSGGLYQKTNLISGTTTLGGLSQGKIMWGVDLSSTFAPLKGLTVSTLNLQNYTLVNTPKTLSGTLKNIGTTVVTSFDLNYTIDGGAPVTQNISGVNIASYASYAYSHANQWTPTTIASFTVKLWASNVNGDPTFISDTITKVVNTVSTLVMKKVVLEEYTGIHCQYCPDGHKRANDYKALHPNDVFLINIHQGGYAVPSAGEPDFRTAFGDALANQTALAGYPSGTINRHLFGSATATALDRGSWVADGNEILATPTYTGMTVTASIGQWTRLLTVTVNANYYSNAPAINLMNVSLIQDSLIGPQTGGSTWNPAQVTSTGQYVHMHMLRHLLTGQWGDTIATTTAGSNFQKTYTYALPENLNSVALNINNLHIVAFIAQGKQEIVTGAESTVAVIASVNDINQNSAIGLYPNPAKDRLTIDLQKFSDVQNAMLMIYDTQGQLVLQQAIQDVRTELNVEALSKGLYIVKISNTKNRVITKFMKD